MFKQLDMENGHETFSEFIAQYTYHSPKSGGYYFNLKRKQTKKKNEYKDMIMASVSETPLTVTEMIPIVQEPDTKSDVPSEQSSITNSTQETISDSPIEKPQPTKQNSIDQDLDEDIFIKSMLDKKSDSDEMVESDDVPIRHPPSVNTGGSVNNPPPVIDDTPPKKPASDDDAINTEELAELEKKLFDSFTTVQVNKPKVSKWTERLQKTIVYIDSKVGEYKHPVESKFKLVRYSDAQHGPYGTQWIHDVQIDDVIDDDAKRRAVLFDKLRAIKLPEQRSEEWFAMRNGAITASDAGVVLGVNKNEVPHSFLIKKCIGKPFQSNQFCHHGTKHEEVATMIYSYRTNTHIEEFGLMMHPTIKFLGASPDGICSKFKLDKTTKSKAVGKMLEIKCPFIRSEWKSEDAVLVDMDPDNKMVVCPTYYWVQVQLQLECCDLDECDFWQCDISEYKTRQDFILDTNKDEPFRSRQYGFEKGCIIQLIPKNKINDRNDPNYPQMVYDESKFIYPTKIEMSPYDCDIWVSEQMDIINTDPKYSNYVFDKVVYWKLVFSRCVTFKRDKKWFNDSLPVFQKMWNYVTFLRNNKMQLDIFTEYINSLPSDSTKSKKKDKEIMTMVEKLCNPNMSGYSDFICTLTEEISSNKAKKGEMSPVKKKQNYGFTEDTPVKSSTYAKKSYGSNAGAKQSSYMFVDYDNDGNVSNNEHVITQSAKPSKPKSSESYPSFPTGYLFTDH